MPRLDRRRRAARSRSGGPDTHHIGVRRWNQCGEALHQLQVRQPQTRCPIGPRPLEPQHHPAAGGLLDAALRQGWAADVPAQPLHRLLVVPAHHNAGVDCSTTARIRPVWHTEEAAGPRARLRSGSAAPDALRACPGRRAPPRWLPEATSRRHPDRLRRRARPHRSLAWPATASPGMRPSVVEQSTRRSTSSVVGAGTRTKRTRWRASSRTKTPSGRRECSDLVLGDVQVQRAAEALDDRDRAASRTSDTQRAPCTASVPSALSSETGGPQEDLEHTAAQVVA